MREKVNQMLRGFRTGKKITFLYLFCIMAPLVITDGVILTLLIRAENEKAVHEMQNIAEAVSYELSSVFEAADQITSSIYLNREMDEFLNAEYKSPLDYYEKSRAMLSSVCYDMAIGYGNVRLLIYADNNTIVSGGHFQQSASVKRLNWYQEFQQADRGRTLLFCYEEPNRLSFDSQRRVSLIRRLDYFHSSEREKFVKLDLDYSSINRNLENMNFEPKVYVCSGERIVFSNRTDMNYTEPFKCLSGKEKTGFELIWRFGADELRILVEHPENMILDILKQYFLLFLLLIGINIVITETILSLINHSYMDRLARQEMELARQNAEIQALHSQINPHFLFNVLESIRMHSVLKYETETAEMIARLARLERQSVRWNSDYVRIEEEIQFVEAYLELQRYRFGRRLSYDIQVDPGCSRYFLPRLTLSTFVENACVHGIEGKQANCWIYIRVNEKNGWLNLEIEDTGSGMSEEQTAQLLEQISRCDINTVKESRHIGILNACLRLKIISDNEAEFEIESETGAGSWFIIRIPTAKLERSVS